MQEVRYYSSLTNGDYAMFNRVNLNKNDIPICVEEPNKDKDGPPIKKYTFYRSPLLLFRALLSLNPNVRCIYEIIKGEKFQKPYYDIDIALKDDPFDEKYSHTKEEKIVIATKIVDLCKKSLMKIRPQIKESDILVLSSHSDLKRSFHIIVDRWCVQSSTLNKELYEEMIQNIPMDIRKYIDNKMYKSIQQFRTFLSSKCGKNRPLIVDKDNSMWQPDGEILSFNVLVREIFIASLITYTDNCILIPMEIKEKVQNVNSKELENEDYIKIMKAFDNFPDRNSFEIGSTSNNFISLKRKRPTFCSVCNRTHENENPFLFVGPTSGNIYFNCRRGEGSITIGNLNDTFHSKVEKNEEKKLTETPKIEDLNPERLTYTSINLTNFVDSGIMSLDVDTNNSSNLYCSVTSSNLSNLPSETQQNIQLNLTNDQNNNGNLQQIDISIRLNIPKVGDSNNHQKISEFKRQVEERRNKWKSKMQTKRPDVVISQFN